MREQTLYIGEGTEVAAQMRDLRIRKGLSGGPVEWLATVVGVILGRQVKSHETQRPEIVDFSRRILTALGFDPDTHRLARRTRPTPGLLVRDAAGEPCGFFSERQLRDLANDPNFLGDYGE